MSEAVAQINDMIDDENNDEFENLLEASEAAVDSNREIGLVILPPRQTDSFRVQAVGVSL